MKVASLLFQAENEMCISYNRMLNALHTTLWAERSFRLTVAGCNKNSSSDSGTLTLIARIDLSYDTAVETEKEKTLSIIMK